MMVSYATRTLQKQTKVLRRSDSGEADEASRHSDSAFVPVGDTVTPFLVGASITGRGVTPARIAAIQRVQHVYGNHAVQQIIQRARSSSPLVHALDAAIRAPTHRDFRSTFAPSQRVLTAVQRELSIDNPDFGGQITIKKLGGNAEGAYLVGDGSGQIVVKPADAPDRTVLAYNLAKDFQVDVPKSRFLPLDSDPGKILIGKVGQKEGGNAELARALQKVKGIILMEFVPGETLGHLKNLGPEQSGQVKKFQTDEGNLLKIGRMAVFDAAILNADRFKIEFGAEANSGNLLFSEGRPVGLDQDFAKIGEEDALEDYKDMFVGKLKPYFANPEKFATDLVAKMKSEGYALFTGMEKVIAAGIRQGIDVLKSLADKPNTRLQKLVEWAHTFVEASSLKTEPIRNYWLELLH